MSERTKYAVLGNSLVLLLLFALIITIVVCLYEFVRATIKLVKWANGKLKKPKQKNLINEIAKKRKSELPPIPIAANNDR